MGKGEEPDQIWQRDEEVLVTGMIFWTEIVVIRVGHSVLLRYT